MGYKTLDQLKEAKIEELAKVPTIGPGIALRIKKQVGEEVKSEIIEEKKENRAAKLQFSTLNKSN